MRKFLKDSNAPLQIRGNPFKGFHFESRLREQKPITDDSVENGFLSAFGMTIKGNYPFARGAPVVANWQPQVRGRPLSKLRDRPALEFKYTGTHYWAWNAPPDSDLHDWHFEGGTACPDGSGIEKYVTRNANSLRFLSRKNGIGMTDWNPPQGENIRGKPVALRDTKLLTGGTPMIEETRHKAKDCRMMTNDRHPKRSRRMFCSRMTCNSQLMNE